MSVLGALPPRDRRRTSEPARLTRRDRGNGGKGALGAAPPPPCRPGAGRRSVGPRRSESRRAHESYGTVHFWFLFFLPAAAAADSNSRPRPPRFSGRRVRSRPSAVHARRRMNAFIVYMHGSMHEGESARPRGRHRADSPPTPHPNPLSLSRPSSPPRLRRQLSVAGIESSRRRTRRPGVGCRAGHKSPPSVVGGAAGEAPGHERS